MLTRNKTTEKHNQTLVDQLIYVLHARGCQVVLYAIVVRSAPQKHQSFKTKSEKVVFWCSSILFLQKYLFEQGLAKIRVKIT